MGEAGEIVVIDNKPREYKVEGRLDVLKNIMQEMVNLNNEIQALTEYAESLKLMKDKSIKLWGEMKDFQSLYSTGQILTEEFEMFDKRKGMFEEELKGLKLEWEELKKSVVKEREESR